MDFILSLTSSYSEFYDRKCNQDLSSALCSKGSLHDLPGKTIKKLQIRNGWHLRCVWMKLQWIIIYEFKGNMQVFDDINMGQLGES